MPPGVYKRKSAEQRFWNYILKTETCWLWESVIDPTGYGKFYDGKRNTYAHRYSYELSGKKIPDGFTIDHLCRNRACVNPNHLEAVTNRDNVLRGIGITAKNARKTHCNRGHSLDGENLWRDKIGRRICRMCKLETGRRAYHKAKAIEKDL